MDAKASRLFAILVLAAVSTLLVVWSVTHAYVGDESFHLLAAKLIAARRKPYIDFFYQHPPGFAYIMAGILRISRVSWRAVHLSQHYAPSAAFCSQLLSGDKSIGTQGNDGGIRRSLPLLLESTRTF